MEEFIFAEQVLNNFDLYKGTDRENAFKMNLKPDFLPENQNTFSLPYFLIPIDSDLILYKKNEEKFFDDNLFLSKNGKIYYPFFVHPETVDFFVSWLNGKYDFIDGDDSIYNATPTSSYRSLLVTNLKTNVKFIVKVPAAQLLDPVNVAIINYPFLQLNNLSYIYILYFPFLLNLSIYILLILFI